MTKVAESSGSGGQEMGMGLLLTTIFIAGQMAGGGVLMLPAAMTNTGHIGLALILYFTLNGAFVGTRLGLCWLMVEEKFPEFKTNKCRDPYPTIAEKAFGKPGRWFATICIIGVQYGTGVGFLILCAKFADNILMYYDVLHEMTPCWLILFWAAFITPLCWFGSPHDFWFVAPSALTATVVACLLIMIKESLDVRDEDSCYFEEIPSPNVTTQSPFGMERQFEPQFRGSIEFLGFGEAFSLIMFAYAGSASFPTYQADMKNKEDFPKAVLFAMIILVFIYLPMAAVGYYQLGLLADNDGGIACVLCDSPIKLAVEILLLIHLISAYPMFLNPPNQFFESMLGIEPTFNWKRVMFRSSVMLVLLFLAESLPSFSAILQLISSVFVTCLTFVFPPLFYMRLFDRDSKKEGKSMHIVTRILCIQAIIIGTLGGVLSFISSIEYIVESDYTPCYIKEMGHDC